MKIKELKERSGMSRANIRFYESKGLLSPARSENGYREYSKEDLEILLRIKRLRFLNVPIEEIEAIQRGEKRLNKVLEKQMGILSQKDSEWESVQSVCQYLSRNIIQYEKLDAREYLEKLESGETLELPTGDGLKVYSPIRRLLARLLDYVLGVGAWLVFAGFVLQGEFFGLAPLVAVFLTILLEPLFLMIGKTTPGKWILGLWIHDGKEKRLNYGKALARTWKILWYGAGLWIPVFSWILLYRNYWDCS